jgi:hypothetical protein
MRLHTVTLPDLIKIITPSGRRNKNHGLIIFSKVNFEHVLQPGIQVSGLHRSPF